MQTNHSDHEKLYRNTACLCARPLLAQHPEERSANLYRCINCGGWRRIPPAEDDANPEPDDRIWYEVAILVLIIIALAAVLIADATLRQNLQLLQEVIRR